MAGKHDIMMCAILFCDLTATFRQHHIRCCYMYVKSQKKVVTNYTYIFYLAEAQEQITQSYIHYRL